MKKPYEDVKVEKEQGLIPKMSKKEFEKCQVKNNLGVKIIQVDEGGKLVVVPWLPEVVTSTVLEDLHRSLTHVGITKVLDVAKMYMAVEDLEDQVARVVSQCEQCLMGKSNSGVNRADPAMIETSRPYQLVAIDLAEFPRTSRDNKYLLICVDHFSKRAYAKPIPNKTAETIGYEFEFNFLPSFVSTPEKLLSDNGTEFQNEIFRSLLEKYQIKHHTIAPGYPKSNGAVERLIGSVKSLIRTTCLEGGEWDEVTPLVLNAYNNTKLHRKSPQKSSWGMQQE